MINPKPDVTIVYPNRCKTCIKNGVPADQRSVVIFSDEERCGVCGNHLSPTNSLTSTMHEVHSPAVRSIIRSLVEHGVFAVDCSFGSWNPIRLCREDAPTGAMITCHINYAIGCSKAPNERFQPYDRSKIACALPAPVSAACELLSNLKLNDRRMSFGQADVKRERKTLRFTWLVPMTELVQQNEAHEKLTIEIAWTAADDGASLLPTPDQTKVSDALTQELQIAADVATLRLECLQEISSGRQQKAIALLGKYSPAAVAQVIGELESRGWNATLVEPTAEISYLSIERKAAA